MSRPSSRLRRVGWELRHNPATRVLWALAFLVAGLLLTVALLFGFWLSLI